eukprot:101086_1
MQKTLRSVSCITVSCKQFSSHINLSNTAYKRYETLKSKRKNKSLGYSDGIISHIAGSYCFIDTRKQISKCTNASQIKSILHDASSTNSALDHTVYGKALQKCLVLCEWQDALDIFAEMPKQMQTIIIYNIMIHGLCKNDRFHSAYALFKKMLQSSHIAPDIQTYTSLIVGCKMRHKANIDFAEQIWNTMIRNEIKPNLIAYNAMMTVYSRAKRLDKVEQIWNEVLRNTAQLDLVGMDAICGNMMNGYALLKQGDKIMQIKQFMHEHNIPLSHIHYSIIIKCFQLRNEPYKIIDIFNNEIFVNPAIKVEHVLISQLSCALLQLMRLKPDNKRLVSKYCRMITKTIPQKYATQWKDFHWNNYAIGTIQFDALLLKYRLSKKEYKLGKHFERLIKKNRLHGYWIQTVIDRSKMGQKQWVIDLHSHSVDAAKFILKYVFEYHETDRGYISQCVHNDEQVIVLCGKGMHNENNIAILNKVVQLELAAWNPPVKAVIHPQDSACLLIDNTDLKKHFEMLSAGDKLQLLDHSL